MRKQNFFVRERELRRIKIRVAKAQTQEAWCWQADHHQSLRLGAPDRILQEFGEQVAWAVRANKRERQTRGDL